MPVIISQFNTKHCQYFLSCLRRFCIQTWMFLYNHFDNQWMRAGTTKGNCVKVNEPDLFGRMKTSDSYRSKNMSSGGEVEVASVLLYSYTYKIQLQNKSDISSDLYSITKFKCTDSAQTTWKSYLISRLCLTRISLPWESFSRTGNRYVPVKSCLWQKNAFLMLKIDQIKPCIMSMSLLYLYMNSTVLRWPVCSFPVRGDTENILLSCTFIWRSSEGLNSALSAQLSSSICWSSGNRNDLSERDNNVLVKIYISTQQTKLSFMYFTFYKKIGKIIECKT